jgi:hypothetical protein
MKNKQKMLEKISERRAFATRKYPKFGKAEYSDEKPPQDVLNSPYYWWFRFLQLNEEYRLAVKRKSSKISKDIVDDLGDVHNIDFKTWWRTHSSSFAEPKTEYAMKVADSKEDLAPFKNQKVINLVVPLEWTNIGIKRRFSEIIDKLVPKETKGKLVKKTQADYKLMGKWNTSGFKYAYAVYIERQKALKEEKETGRRVVWADIAIRAKIPLTIGMKEGDTHMNSDNRKKATVLAKRYYEKAQMFIGASASNRFPR